MTGKALNDWFWDWSQTTCDKMLIYRNRTQERLRLRRWWHGLNLPEKKKFYDENKIQPNKKGRGRTSRSTDTK